MRLFITAAAVAALLAGAIAQSDTTTSADPATTQDCKALESSGETLSCPGMHFPHLPPHPNGLFPTGGYGNIPLRHRRSVPASPSATGLAEVLADINSDIEEVGEALGELADPNDPAAVAGRMHMGHGPVVPGRPVCYTTVFKPFPYAAATTPSSSSQSIAASNVYPCYTQSKSSWALSGTWGPPMATWDPAIAPATPSTLTLTPLLSLPTMLTLAATSSTTSNDCVTTACTLTLPPTSTTPTATSAASTASTFGARS